MDKYFRLLMIIILGLILFGCHSELKTTFDSDGEELWLKLINTKWLKEEVIEETNTKPLIEYYISETFGFTCRINYDYYIDSEFKIKSILKNEIKGGVTSFNVEVFDNILNISEWKDEVFDFVLNGKYIRVE